MNLLKDRRDYNSLDQLEKTGLEMLDLKKQIPLDLKVRIKKKLKTESIIQEVLKNAIIKKCPKKDQDDRPLSEQQYCLYDSEGEKLLGRHPSKEKALNQEKAIQIHKYKR